VSVLDLRAADECRWDVVALGEVMLRLDPGDARIATTRQFRVWEGGGEYNVARGLRRCFGLRSGIVTALADNPVGRLLEDLILQGGTDPAHLGWISYDGIGRTVRNGLNFTERGFGVRAPLGCSDRANTAASQLAPGDVDWTRIFVHGGTRWFHCGGIFAALSDTTPLVCEEAMLAARAANVVVSYDLNYRPSLWNAVGGSARAAQVNRRLVELSDVLFGNEEDLELALGFDADGLDPELLSLDPDVYARLLGEVMAALPNLSLVATTLRQADSATRNDWSAVCRTRTDFHVGPWMRDLEILDRVGGGDSFASGLIYGLLTERDVGSALAFGIAHGALAMTTPGDASMATLAEVERVADGGAVRVVR
jgi:2-dehydro-3-deoxygluconokinase